MWCNFFRLDSIFDARRCQSFLNELTPYYFNYRIFLVDVCLLIMFVKRFCNISNDPVFIPPHLSSVSALPCKTDKHRNCLLFSQCRMIMIAVSKIKLELLDFSLLNLEKKSMASITGMFFYHRKCYLL